METSDVRKQVLRAIEQTRQRAASRRTRNTDATKAFDAFLKDTAVPLVRQIANVLKAEGVAFTVFTPSSSVRLMSDRSTEDFIEVSLETDGETPQVMCRTSRNRGSRVIQSERAFGTPEAMTEGALLEFLMIAIEPFVER
jgi:hypothetical protein